MSISTDGELIVTYTDSTVVNLGNIKGEKGDKGDRGEKGDQGAAGRGIAKTELVNGELIITYTDGTSDNLGSITSGSTETDTSYLKFTKINGGKYKVEINDDYRSTIKSVTVPPKYNGLPVTYLADRAFYQCTKLSNVILPDTIKSIGENAFGHCSSLKNIVLPEGMEKLDRYVFANTGLESIELPDNISVLPYQCFYNCKSLKSVKLPSKLIEIGDWSFSGCTSLTNITLPNSIQEIDSEAFYNCDSLESLTITKNVKKLEYLFVSGNTNVKLIFEDTSGWQKRYVTSFNATLGDWENIDPAVMANSDSFKNLMKTSYKDSKGYVYYYEFQKV